MGLATATHSAAHACRHRVLALDSTRRSPASGRRATCPRDGFTGVPRSDEPTNTTETPVRVQRERPSIYPGTGAYLNGNAQIRWRTQRECDQLLKQFGTSRDFSWG